MNKTNKHENTGEVLDKLISKLTTWAEKGKEEGSHAIKIAKIKMNISSLNIRIEEKFLEAGKKCYELYLNKNEHDIFNEDLKNIFSDIKIFEQKIARHEKLIIKLKDKKNKILDEEF